MLNIAILFGSVRRDRIGIKPATYLLSKCRERGHETSLVDAMELDLPILDRMYKEYEKGQAPENLERLAEIIRRADGYIIIAASTTIRSSRACRT